MALEQHNTAFEFETMLRRQLSSKTRAHGSLIETCAGFDADAANAYLENALGAATRTRYESHLADCSSCRHHLLQLSRLIQQPQTEPQFIPVVKPVSIWSHWKSVATEWMGMLNASLGKQGWATAGAAVAVLITVVSVQFWRQQQASVVGQPEAARVALTNGNDVPSPEISTVPYINGNSESGTQDAYRERQNLALNKVPTPQVSPMPGDTNVASMQALIANSKPSGEFSSTVPPAPPQQAPGTLVSSFTGRTAFGPPVQTISAEIPAPPPDLLQSESVLAAHITPLPGDNPMARKTKGNSNSSSSRSPFAKALSFMPTAKADSDRKLEEKEIEPDSPKVLTIRRRDKVFNYQGGLWIDSVYKSEMAWRVTKLTFDSDEFNQLISAEPQLKEYFAHGPAIVVWKDKIYKVVSK
ncbi:MAG: zf-HC2 domain-containing protein [Acidobacteria bacterium]|nr:zf-HC2 domain-containing protein [Acidobacteriota bacterium]